MNRSVRALVGLVAGHLVLTLLHGAAHGVIPVHIADWQGAYSAVVLFAAPVVGVALAIRSRVRAGAVLLVSAGVGALAFEGIFHFVVVNPDHVATVDAGQSLFAVTAALSTFGDVSLVGGAAWAAWKWCGNGVPTSIRSPAR